MEDGTKYISGPGEALIKAAFDGTYTGREAIDKNMSTPKMLDTLLALTIEQQKTIQDLTVTNRELTAALENTTASLRAAQALHVGTMQKHLTDGADSSSGFFTRMFRRNKS